METILILKKGFEEESSSAEYTTFFLLILLIGLLIFKLFVLQTKVLDLQKKYEILSAIVETTLESDEKDHPVFIDKKINLSVSPPPAQKVSEIFKDLKSEKVEEEKKDDEDKEVKEVKEDGGKKRSRVKKTSVDKQEH